MIRHHAFIAFSLVALSAIPLSADAASRDEQEKACRGDAMHFCSAEIPNEDKITACMKQHVAELSPACKAMFKEGQAKKPEKTGG
jgi:hypothetical protein